MDHLILLSEASEASSLLPFWSSKADGVSEPQPLPFPSLFSHGTTVRCLSTLPHLWPRETKIGWFISFWLHVSSDRQVAGDQMQLLSWSSFWNVKRLASVSWFSTNYDTRKQTNAMRLLMHINSLTQQDPWRHPVLIAPITSKCLELYDQHINTTLHLEETKA